MAEDLEQLKRDIESLRQGLQNVRGNIGSYFDRPIYEYPGADPVGGPVPIGGIIMWSGEVAAIPEHWALCDGSNGTPDLRDRMVVGAGTTYTPGDTGGSATQASHTGHGTHGLHANHPTHDPHSHSNEGSHDHTSHANRNDLVNGGSSSALINTNNHDSDGLHNHDAHSHDGHSTHTAHSSDGQISAHGTNLPPYYALAYIMRVT